MAGKTPRPQATQERILTPVLTQCPECGRRMWWDYTNDRKVATLEGGVRLGLQIRRCPNSDCSRYHRPYRPEEEGRIVLPHYEYGLDVLALLGALRYQGHGSVPEIYRALVERGVSISQRNVTYLLERYDELVALSVSQAPARCERLQAQGRLILAIDGLQPEVGHEVLWVVREVLGGEVLLARSLLSSTEDDLVPLLREATGGFKVPVVGVVSDGERSVRNAVAQVFPGVAHQLCHFHYLRQAAGPMWEADRHAKKELKKRVRGIRPLERAVEGGEDEEAEIIQGYCAAVRSALSDDGRSPLEAGGLKLEARLWAVSHSLDRVAEKRGAPQASGIDEDDPAPGIGGHCGAVARSTAGVWLGRGGRRDSEEPSGRGGQGGQKPLPGAPWADARAGHHGRRSPRGGRAFPKGDAELLARAFSLLRRGGASAHEQ